jgi:hypothetical protein
LAGLQPKPLKNNDNTNNSTPNQHKFTDAIFPPVYSSLFALQKSNLPFNKIIGSEIIWKRIPDVFNGKLILKGIKDRQNKLFITAGKYSS